MSHEPARKVTCVKPDHFYQFRIIRSVAEGIEPLFQQRYLRRLRQPDSQRGSAGPGDANPSDPGGV